MCRAIVIQVGENCYGSSELAATGTGNTLFVEPTTASKPRIGQHQAVYVDIPSKLLQFKNNMNELSNFKTHQNTPDNMQSNFNS